MKIRISALLLALLMVVTLFAGCSIGGNSSEEVIIIEEGEEGSTNDSNGDSTSGGEDSGSAQKPIASKPSTSTTTAVGTDGKTIKLVNPVSIAKGTSPMEKGLNFGGKTQTMAITEEPVFTAASFKRLVAAFEKEYNCKISMKTLKFDNYVQQATQQMSTGKSFDIMFMHGSKFPTMPISGLTADLSAYMTTADYDTGKGGIDISKSSHFVYGKDLTAVCGGENAVYPVVIFYNKALFKENDLDDPYTLYKQGKWTWTKFREMGKKVTNESKKVWFGGYNYRTKNTVLSMGQSLWDWVNNEPKMYWLTDSNIFKGMQMTQRFFQTDKILIPQKEATGGEYNLLTSGKIFTTTEESQKYEEIAALAANSAVFNRNYKNLGIVPMPQDSAAAKRGYPTGWLTGISAGKGSDARVAVAFTKFWSTYKDPVANKYAMTAEEQALCDKLIAGNLALIHGQYSNATTDTGEVFDWSVMMHVVGGEDIASRISSQKSVVEDCIKQTLKK